MAATKYDFAISSFASGLDTHTLSNEIQASSIVTVLDRIDTDDSTCSIWFRDTLSGSDVTVLNAVAAAHAGVAVPEPPLVVEMSSAEQGDRALRVAQVGRLGSEVIYATHNFCDRTTWYSESERATDEVLSDSGDGLTFESVHQNWVDMTHGKVMDEEAIAEENEPTHLYRVVVTVDDAAQTQRAPFASSGGDYDVDYVAGTVTFFSSQAGKAVKASYSYEDGSTWIMRPSPGKQIKIEQAEAQFSEDVVLLDTIRFGAWGWADVFAPQLVPDVLPSGTQIELQATRYMRLDQIIDEALGSYPVIPAMGGSARGNAQARYGFPFRYGAVRVLSSAAGMELRVTLEAGIAYAGERATATFYCSSEDA